MSTDFNNTSMFGRATHDGEMKYTPGGTAVLRFNIANNRSFKKDDDWKTEVCYMECQVWGKYAESISDKIKKGVTVIVSGRLKQDTWDDQDGKKRSKHFLVCDNVFIITKSEKSGADKVNEGFNGTGPETYDDEIGF